MPFIIKWVDHCSGVEEIAKMDTPAGKLVLYTQSGVVTRTDWELADSLQAQQINFKYSVDQDWLNPAKPVHIKLLQQGSPFRNRVWSELCKIPFGETISYSALARNIDSAARAVGNACRDNPYPLLIPCHRVVSVSGMGGYSGKTEGDFMTIKHKLLEFESAFKL